MTELESIRADLEYWRDMAKRLERALHDAIKIIEDQNRAKD